MNEGINIERLKTTIDRNVKKQIPEQVVWAVIKTVDWDKKQCIATGMVDNLDYHEVGLGVGNMCIKPVVGAKCLIGTIGNQNADVFLIDVSEFEEKIYTSGDTEFHITKDGFIIKRNDVDLKEILENTLNQLKNAKILTPSGPGSFSPADKIKFEEFKNEVLNLFK